MEYTKKYKTKDEHIDVQDIMDGLYYPFYMEECRHSYIREVLGFDFEKEAANGIFMVLSKYTIQFVRSLKRGDEFIVTCEVLRDKNISTLLHFKQSIVLNGKVMTKGVFSGTCIPAKGGRPFLPSNLTEQLSEVPYLDVEG